MKKILLLSVLIASLLTTTNAEKIEWLTNFKESKALAQQTGKPLLLDFTAKWCEPCQVMDKTFWVNKAVVEKSKDYVCVKVNYDRSASLKRKYRIRAIPFVLMSDSWGMELASHRGYGNGSGRVILRKMQLVPNDFSEIREAQGIVKTDKKNLNALTKISDFYHLRKFYYQSNEFSEKALKLIKTSETREKLMLKIAINYLRASQPDKAKKFLSKFQKEFPQSGQMDVALYGQVIMHKQKNNLKKARKAREQLKAKFPDSSYLRKADDAL